MVAGTVLAVPVPTTGTNAVPANATSVVISLSGTGAQGSTYLAVYSKVFRGNSTLNLSSKNPNDTVTAVVKLNSSHGFMLRNSAAPTHAVISVLGYFGAPTASGGLGYVALPSRRLLDTRVPTGIAKKAKLAPNQSVTVNAGPAGCRARDGGGGQHDRPEPDRRRLPDRLPERLTGDGVARLPALLASPTWSRFRWSRASSWCRTATPAPTLMIDIVGYFSPTATARFVTLPNPAADRRHPYRQRRALREPDAQRGASPSTPGAFTACPTPPAACGSG